jgi:hypothetical protein
MKLWLVTWDWAGDAAAVADIIAALFPPQWSENRVSLHVEMLYALVNYNTRELAEYAKHPSRNPYKALAERGIISCGHNPWLTARQVRDFQVETTDNGLETITWTEPDTYGVGPDGHLERVTAKSRQAVTRRLRGPLSSKLIWDRVNDRFLAGWGPGEVPEDDG